MTDEVVVITGVGGMGEAIARRQGPGRKLLLADFNDNALESVASRLSADGYDAQTQHVDVGSAESVQALAQAAAAVGAVTQLVHTAGLSPMQASPAEILRVDLYGVAAVLEAFGEVIASGGAGVVIASMAGHMVQALPPDQESELVTAPADRLLALSFLAPEHVADSGYAYSLAKRANRLRVAAESIRWGRRGARLNSISPGIISTPMGREELDGDHGQHIRALIGASVAGRAGTATDIANAVAFLLGPESSFITGTDILVDGGVVASLTSGAASGFN